MLDSSKSRYGRAWLNPLSVAIVVCAVAGIIAYAFTHRLESGLVLTIQKLVCLATGKHCFIEAPFSTNLAISKATSFVGRRVFVSGVTPHSAHPRCGLEGEAVSGRPAENQRRHWPSQQVRTAGKHLAEGLRAAGAEIVEQLEQAEFVFVGYVSKSLPATFLESFRGGGEVYVWADISIGTVSNGCPDDMLNLTARYECRYPLASASACVPVFLDDMLARLGGVARPLAFRRRIDLRS